MTLEWIEREEPLALCPKAWCRRAGACRNAGTATPCLRTHEDMDDFRNRLADKLDAITREIVAARGYALPRCSPYELDFKMAEMKRLLQEADAEDTARRMKALA
jgi:hypothetical protein